MRDPQSTQDTPDGLARGGRLVDAVVRTISDPTARVTWMRTPQDELDGCAPLDAAVAGDEGLSRALALLDDLSPTGRALR